MYTTNPSNMLIKLFTEMHRLFWNCFGAEKLNETRKILKEG